MSIRLEYTQTQARPFLFSTYAPSIHRQSAIAHTKLHPSMTSIMVLMRQDEWDVRWPTRANGWTATEHNKQRGRALAQGWTEAGHTDRRTPIVSDSSMGVMTSLSILLSNTMSNRWLAVLTHTMLTHIDYWLLHFMFARMVSFIISRYDDSLFIRSSITLFDCF